MRCALNNNNNNKKKPPMSKTVKIQTRLAFVWIHLTRESKGMELMFP